MPATPTEFTDAIDEIVAALKDKESWKGDGKLFGARVYRDADFTPRTTHPYAVVRPLGESVFETLGTGPKSRGMMPVEIHVHWAQGFDAPSEGAVHGAMLASVQTAMGKLRAEADTDPASKSVQEIRYTGGGTQLEIDTPDADPDAVKLFSLVARFEVMYEFRSNPEYGEP